MANVNSVSLSGALDDDPALMRTLEGREILAFTLRVDGLWVNEDGTVTSVDNFVSCRVGDERAFPLSKALSRGSHVALCGTIVQPKRIGTAQVRPDAHMRVDVARIDVLDAPCSGETLKEALGLNGYGEDGRGAAGAE